ncbi:MAG: WecB/TagA/CpsF family glycosyltransferase [Synechococcus sp.]
MKLQTHSDFYRAYASATYRVCDSQILKFAFQLVGQPIREKISGSDLLPAYIDYYRNDPNVKLFLLGAAEGVAEEVQHHVNQRANREMVVGVYSPSYGFEADEIECQQIINRIERSQATTLVVGLGAPKQEIWIHQNRRKLKTVRTFLAIGAGLDFLSGNQQRSPRWMSNCGLEWLYRLLSEPKRLWKRYLVESLPFFWLVPQQVVGTYRSPKFGTAELDRATDIESTNNTLVRAGLLTEEQLAVVSSQQQADPHQSMADIISAQGWLKQQTIDFFVNELPRIEGDMRQKPLGVYLVDAGLLSSMQLAFLLRDKQRHGGNTTGRYSIGDRVVQNGWIARKTVDFFLTEVAPDCELIPYEIFERPSIADFSGRRRFPRTQGMERAAT